MAGAIGAFLPLAVTYLTTSRLATLTGVPLDSLFRHGAAQVALIGAVVLGVTALLCLLCGFRAFLAAGLLAAVEVGAAAPMLLGASESSSKQHAWIAAVAVGLVAGLLAGIWRLRALGAAFGAAALCLAALIATAATGGQVEKLVTRQVWQPGLPLMAGVVFTALTAAATGATMLHTWLGRPAPRPLSALVVVFGILLPLLVQGGRSVLLGDTLGGGGSGGSGGMVVSAALLAVAAVGLLAVAAAGIGSGAWNGASDSGGSAR